MERSTMQEDLYSEAEDPLLYKSEMNRRRWMEKRRRQRRSRILLCTGCIILLSIVLVVQKQSASEHQVVRSENAQKNKKAVETSADLGNTQGKSSEGKTEGSQEDDSASGVDTSAWYMILVNGSNPLPEGYTADLTELTGGEAVDSRIYDDLQAMMSAAEKEGLSPVICSSYRSLEKQTALFEEQVAGNMADGTSREEAEKAAAVWVAPPGTSEHQLGLALDIVSQSYQGLDEAQEETAEQKWLMKHCAEYGFILRYPTDKSDITGIGYEPWHYRYVGKKAAKEIMKQGICLEEYLEAAKGN